MQAYTCINLNVVYNWAKKQKNSRKVDSVWLLDINQNLFCESDNYIYLSAFLDTGLPRGNVHKRDSGPTWGAIPTQSHNP